MFLSLLIAGLSAAPAKQKFTGIITDSQCARANHKAMGMGSNDAECTIACIYAHGAQYVLFTGKEAYVLSDQKTPEKFAAKKVTILGVLDAKTKTLQVASITASK
ncbi:MAG: hypothetical protein ABI995_01190 [Acidobacteriota bacterium]